MPAVIPIRKVYRRIRGGGRVASVVLIRCVKLPISCALRVNPDSRVTEKHKGSAAPEHTRGRAKLRARNARETGSPRVRKTVRVNPAPLEVIRLEVATQRAPSAPPALRVRTGPLKRPARPESTPILHLPHVLHAARTANTQSFHLATRNVPRAVRDFTRLRVGVRRETYL